jgi:cell division protein FtsB
MALRWSLDWNALNNIRTAIVVVFAGLAAALAAGAWWSAHPAWLEMRALEAHRAGMAARLDAANQRLEERRGMLRRLHEDPVFVERTIRSRLGYVREGEMVFRFPEN